MPVSPLAWTLPPDLVAQYVFRAATFSVVMMLALGQASALLCSTWCPPAAVAASPCGHNDSGPSPSLTASDECLIVSFTGPAAVVGSNVRQTDPGSAQQMIAVGALFGPAAGASPSDHHDIRRQSPRHQPIGALRL